MNQREVIKKIKSYHWQKWLDRPFNPFILSLFKDGITKKYFNKIGVKDVECEAFVYQGRDWYESEDVWSRMDKGLGKYLSRNNIFDVTKSLDDFYNAKKKRIIKLIKENKNISFKLKELYKILSRKYIENHYKNAYLTINKLNQFLRNNLKSNNVKSEKILLYIQYSNLFEELLSYYRASRPEIFEIVEEILKKDKTISKKYYKSLILKYGKLRFDLKKAWLDAEQKVKKFKISLARSLGLSLNELEYLTIKEVKILTTTKDVKKYRKLINYRKLCIFGIIKGKKVLITNKEIISVIKNKLEPKIDSQKIIYGKTANKGLAKGKARIISQLNYRQMIAQANLFKKGEVLVMGMTQPDIVFACRKAKAIITEEGGITSHVAIISRELGIPCIIGTKIATKVLKDGDIVLVDANQGEVKVITKN